MMDDTTEINSAYISFFEKLKARFPRATTVGKYIVYEVCPLHINLNTSENHIYGAIKGKKKKSVFRCYETPDAAMRSFASSIIAVKREQSKWDANERLSKLSFNVKTELHKRYPDFGIDFCVIGFKQYMFTSFTISQYRPFYDEDEDEYIEVISQYYDIKFDQIFPQLALDKRNRIANNKSNRVFLGEFLTETTNPIDKLIELIRQHYPKAFKMIQSSIECTQDILS